ncbi:MAG TPA: peptidoglycan-binding protein [Acetobacteraceae bacterium]|jgi:peptidoglycan hydrolase-like protein with peptidoglycan-binding domain|nr:peptidoglycan-binding protein [Acetobacteraceae bacterium]
MPVTIGLGATGDDVKRVQRALARQLLWNPFGPITGVYDATLEASVKLFQQGNGLPVTGTVDGATWAKLPAYKEASPTLRSSDTGPVVAWLQQALKGQDIVIEFTPYAGVIDGIFGPLTEAAVRALQTWAGATPDGIVGDNTWFTWMTPGSAQQLTLERACGLLDGIGP